MGVWLSGAQHTPEQDAEASGAPTFTPNPSNANPYPVEIDRSKGFVSSAPASAPASPDTTGSGGARSIPRLESIPEGQAMTALLKLKGM